MAGFEMAGKVYSDYLITREVDCCMLGNYFYDKVEWVQLLCCFGLGLGLGLGSLVVWYMNE